MAYLPWNDSYSIGVELFDNEHKQLVAIANELYDAVAQEVDVSALERILDRLIEHVVLHFRHEEMYFDDWNYPEKAEHLASHRRLRREIFNYRERLHSQPSPELASALFEFLRLWLTQHILTEDRAYGAFLIAKGLR